MKRFAALFFAALILTAISAPASHAFGLKEADVRIVDENGAPSMEAGTHPFAIVNHFEVETEIDPEVGEIPAGQLREASGEFPPGLTGSPYAVPQCLGVDFATTITVGGILKPNCSDSSVLGQVEARVTTDDGGTATVGTPLYNLVPPPGAAAKVGFHAEFAPPVTIVAGVKDTPPYNLIYAATNVTQAARVLGTDVTLWGNPSDPSHDEERGSCGLIFIRNGVKFEVNGSCPTSNPNKPFLTLPRSCQGPLPFTFDALSWTGERSHTEVLTHDNSVPPNPLGIGGCDKLGFGPEIDAQPTSTQAESPTGLDFKLDVDNPGLQNPEGTSRSDIEKAVVTLPEGMTVNPSQAEGLAVCSQADFARETATSEFGAGCPAASKIGTVEVETPLLEGKILKGSLFVAEPFKNPFNTLIALYMTFKEPELGIGIKLAGKVEPDPLTGRLIATFEDLPQQPFSHFRLHFREGGRSPLITPPTCGTYTTQAVLTPWADPDNPLTTSSAFAIAAGVNGSPCPSGGKQPFEPGFTAGTLNNRAGGYSPFHARITRRDGDQDLTKATITLPLGLTAKLAGVSRCPDAQISLAKTKTGTAELASPSCPLNSQIGTVTAGAGVGSQLVYVLGKMYLAGPYNGAPLSVLEVVPAVAGPFDVGTVVVRQALLIDPRTAEVKVDGDRSDPIPHILAGIPLRVRDIRVDVNRSDFTLNPTSCEREQIAAKLWGGGANPFSAADDSPVSRSQSFQAADCAALAFKPKLSLKLKGGTKRGAHPSLRAVLKPRPGDANISGAIVRLPHSAFLDQAHIRTICTRVQFAADNCPKGAIYGRVRAFTPLLDEPLEGPVFLRSSNHNLPDLVFDLHGLVDFEAVGRIDSKNGGIRTTFTQIPDAPISKVIVSFEGGKKGLVINSTDLCAKARRGNASFDAHNGKQLAIDPVVQATGCKGKK
jgi:hypothetical protein